MNDEQPLVFAETMMYMHVENTFYLIFFCPVQLVIRLIIVRTAQLIV
jgi:hypothetical protein